MKSECKYSFEQARVKLEAWCAYQERCHAEIWSKMQGWGLSYEDQHQLISHLISTNFLNEERFAEAFVSGKFNIKKWGRIKIKAHLKQKNISPANIEKGIKCIEADSYVNTLASLAEKKEKELAREKDAYLKKAKIIRFLQAKGYESDLIFDVVEKLLSSK